MRVLFFCWKVLVTSSKYLWTVLFLIWALPSYFQPSHDRLIQMPGSSVSTFFQWEYVYRAEKVIKAEGLRPLFETAGICLHLCGDTCWNATTNIFMFSETIYGISIDVFLNILSSLTLCIYWKQRKVYLLIYWKLFMHIAFLWRTETKPTHSCPKEETVLEFQPGYSQPFCPSELVCQPFLLDSFSFISEYYAPF